MAVAYSKSHIASGTIRTGSQAQLRGDLDTLVTSAGWTTKRAVATGFVYTITSPDGFTCKVLVVDDGSFDTPAQLYGSLNTCVVIQFLSFDETVKGYAHQLLASSGAAPLLQVVVGICQIFIAAPGQVGTRFGQVAGGIPARPANTGPCVAGVGPAAITDLWWSCGGTPFFQWVALVDFRSGPNCNGGSCYCQNGMVSLFNDAGTAPFDGRLCLFPLTPTGTYRVYHAEYPVITYQSHNPLCIDALLGWQWKIRGQLWDAFLQTAAIGSVDDLVAFEDTDGGGNQIPIQTISWHVSFYSTLRLIYGDPVSGGDAGSIFGNIAY